MDEKWKKILYTGIGMAANVSEKLKEKVEDLMENKNINTDEAKKTMEDFIDTAAEKKEVVEEKLKEFLDNVKEKFEAVSEAPAEVEKLKSKVANLKERLAKYETVEEEE